MSTSGCDAIVKSILVWCLCGWTGLIGSPQIFLKVLVQSNSCLTWSRPFTLVNVTFRDYILISQETLSRHTDGVRSVYADDRRWSELIILLFIRLSVALLAVFSVNTANALCILCGSGSRTWQRASSYLSWPKCPECNVRTEYIHASKC